MTKIDLFIVSGRRPDLLNRTLDSFDELVFKNFQVETVVVNIDPIFGNETDHSVVRKLVLGRFPQAKLIEPSTPNFGQAVKSLWANARDNIVLHLEDDWIALQPITPDMVVPFLNSRVKSATLNWKTIGNIGPGKYHMGKRKRQLFGKTIIRHRMYIFGTSPRFLDPIFARKNSELMNPELDPENQMRPGFNNDLFKYIAPYRAFIVKGFDQPNVIEDIGREWRDIRGITKKVINGVSHWGRSPVNTLTKRNESSSSFIGIVR